MDYCYIFIVKNYITCKIIKKKKKNRKIQKNLEKDKNWLQTGFK